MDSTVESASNANVVTVKNILGLFCLVLSLCIAMLGIWDDARLIIGLLLVSCSLCLIVHVRRNVILFVICFVIMYSNYSAVVANVFPPYSGYDTMYSNSPYSAETLLACMIFMSTLLMFIPAYIPETPFFSLFSCIPSFKYRIVSTLVLSIALLVIFASGLSGLFAEGRASVSSIFEYAYLLLLVGFLLSGDSKVCRSIFLILAILYIVQPLLGGNRANMLNVALLFFVLFASNRFTWKSVLPLLLVGTLFLVTFGYYRSSDHFGFLYIVSQMRNALITTVQNSFIWDTASYAFQQSVAFLDLKDDINIGTSLYLLGQWVQSWFLGSSVVPDSALPVYVQERIGGLGGGFLPVYFYFYFGVPGVILSGAMVGFWFKKIACLGEAVSPAMAFLSVGIAVTVCRWYLYSPAAFTSSMSFSIVICVFLSFFVNNFFKPRSVVDRGSPDLRVQKSI